MLFKSIVSLTVVASAAAAAAVKGKAFDHIFIVFLENTDYDKAATDPTLMSYFPEAVHLDNYYGVTHPSEPNYIAASGGDYFGMADDDRYAIPSNYTTIVDLLEPKGLTWRAYQEDAPTPCFKDFQNDGKYFRKHNPFIIYDSIANNATRCSNVVPATQLQADIAAGNMPNYAFYTPNMVNDGHNSTVAVASNWLKGFLTPLLADKTFNNNTLVVVTFDETETYALPNRVLAFLLGDTVAALKNTTDSTFYTHYSLLSTVESNWDLGNLGRQDTNTTLNNVFNYVAKLTGAKNNNITVGPLLNDTIPGFLTKSSTTSGAGSTPTGKPSAAAGVNTVSKAAFAVAALAGAFAALL
ncbi:phosphoesterase family-domain-containing protein [Linnemannia elongata]|nr:phosphoesterase family-domain-containing protein [Linnemannia elongata]